jgi:hypothetical protein
VVLGNGALCSDHYADSSLALKNMQKHLSTWHQEVIMKCNVGGMDRTGRIVLGIVLLLVGLAAPIATTWRIVALVIAAIALVTAAVRFCPVNAIFGINSCESKSRK